MNLILFVLDTLQTKYTTQEIGNTGFESLIFFFLSGERDNPNVTRERRNGVM